MRVTIQEIAEQLHVSAATVSRVLNGHNPQLISAATRERVLVAAREMGYRPNRAARALVTGRTNLIALWMPNLHEPFYASIVHHVQQQVQPHGLDLIVQVTHDHVPEARWPVDGILACDFLQSLEALESAAGETPWVSMGSYTPEKGHIVGVDLHAGALEAVRHLLTIGCQRIAYLSPPWGLYHGDARRDAYVAELNAAGREPEFIEAANHTRAASRDAIIAYVTAHGTPDGLFCRNDDMAIGAYRALRDLGLRIPEDVALIGCDGIEDTEYLDTPLTTLIQPIEAMCAVAWEVLRTAIQVQTNRQSRAVSFRNWRSAVPPTGRIPCGRTTLKRTEIFNVQKGTYDAEQQTDHAPGGTGTGR